jgi:hypothetical protein
MAASSGPDVIDAGLVLAIDAADRNSFDSNENLLTRSEEFNDGVWAKSQISITSNAAIAPDGSLTADKLVEASLSNNQYHISQGSAGGNATYTHSLFAKQAETDRHLYFEVGYTYVSINLSTGTVFAGPGTFYSGWSNPTVSIIPYPNGWYRCIITGTADNTVTSVSAKIHTATLTGGAGGIVYTGNGTSGIYIWGAQLERGSSPSPYYPTTATTKTRGSTLIDLTGRGNTGTLVNGPTYSSANGGSIVFDGTNDYVNLGNILNFTTESFTFNVWFYLSNFIPSDPIQGPILFYKGQFQSNGYYCQFGQNGSINFVTNQNTTYQGSGTAAGIVSLNTWYCLSLVRSGSNITIYVNGNQSSSSNSHINPTSSSDSFLLCSYNFGIYSNFRISQFSAYNRALTASEIQQNFNATRSRFGI